MSKPQEMSEDEAFAVFNIQDDTSVEGDTTEEENNTEGENNETTEDTSTVSVDNPEETETTERQVKQIVKAKDESEDAFNLRKRIAEKQAEKIGASEERKAEIQSEIRSLRGGFKQIKQNTSKLSEEFTNIFQNQEHLNQEMSIADELARANGYLKGEDLDEYIQRITENKAREQQNNTILDDFLDSKPEFAEDDLADAFVDMLNDTGMDWNRFTPKQTRALLEGFYTAQFGNKVSPVEVQKAAKVTEKIQATSFSNSNGGASSAKIQKIDKEEEQAWTALGF